MRRFFIFAGEASGDLHGSRLMQAFKQQTIPPAFTGVAGPLMRKEGIDCLLPMEEFQVMGLTDVLANLPKLWRQFRVVRDAILKSQPDCVIMIDYPGFNLRLAKALRKHGYKGKLVQMICPTVWAHGKNRIETMSQTLNLLLTIYPFEASFFNGTGLAVRYIGSPLAEALQTYIYDDNWKSACHLPTDPAPIALFPGSREGEVRRNLPLQLAAANRMKNLHPQAIFAVSVGHENLLPLIQRIVRESGLQFNKNIFFVPKRYSYELMRDSQSALAKSGTVTLELALHSCPTVVLYALSRLNHFFAKYILKLQLPHYCMVNILGNKEIFPEFIGTEIDITQLAAQLERLTCETSIRNRIKFECQSISELLDHGNSSRLAVQAIEELA